MPRVSFTDPRWSVLNPPEKDLEISKDGSTLKMVTLPGRDWYNTPEWSAKSGTVYGFKYKVGEGGVTVSVDVDIDYKDQYDQAGVFFHINDSLWFKFGLELEGDLFSGTVVTQPYSDWSLVPAKDHKPTTFSFTLKGRQLKIFNDGVMTREVRAFGSGDKESESDVFIGVMACSPKGGGRVATFRNFSIEDGVEEEEDQ